MAKGPDETTDRMFPPAENPNPARPVPLAPSIREEFVAHRLEIEAAIKGFDTRLGEALAQLAPAQTVGGALRRGAAAGGQLTVKLLAVLAVVEIAIKALKPEWSGLLEGLREAIGG